MSIIYDVDTWLEQKFIKEYNDKHKDNRINNYQSLTFAQKCGPYSILQIQPATCLKVDATNGLTSLDKNYYLKLNNFFKKTFNQKYDFVFTPEYSVPLKSIEFLLENNKQIKTGTLYCLCCEGITTKVLHDFLCTLKKYDIEINKHAVENWVEGNIVCCLLYITKIKFSLEDGSMEKIFAFPQFKTTPMKDTEMLFETRSLTIGTTVFSFGKPNEVQFLSIICSDVFNYDLSIEIKKKMDNNKMVVFHPQLNSKPQNDYFRFMRSLFLNYAYQDNTRIISLNWAKDTQFSIEGEKSYPIKNSWTSLFNLYTHNDFSDHVSIVDKEANNGLNIAHDHHIIMFYFSSREHIIDMNIKQLPTSTRPADIQNTIMLSINSIEAFDSYNYLCKPLEYICDGMIDNLFRTNEHFSSFFNCDKCKSETKRLCGIGKVNEFMSLVLNEKNVNQFEIINDGQITSLTSKDYKSKYSREKIYICKKILHLIETGQITKKFKCGYSNFNFCVIKDNDCTYNLKLIIDEYGTFEIRVLFLKYATKRKAQEVFNAFCNKSSKYAENLVIYYEDEIGVNIFPDDDYFSTSIVTGKIAENQVSILGGH